jgi:hypothetical protein
MIVPGDIQVIEEEAMPAVEEEASAERRRKYSKEQLDVLYREFMEGSARMKNEEIAKEISRLNGA